VVAPRRRARKNIAIGQAHIKTSFNNTIVRLTDPEGNVIVWESAGSGGLQGLAQVDAVRRAGDGRRGRAQGHGARPAEGRGLRQGPGLRSRDRRSGSLQAAGLEILGVKDVSPQAHNGVRPKKRRRV
jgi:small subunit ribosomal protein S11